jgi:hypothetical protein
MGEDKDSTSCGSTARTPTVRTTIPTSTSIAGVQYAAGHLAPSYVYSEGIEAQALTSAIQNVPVQGANAAMGLLTKCTLNIRRNSLMYE